jgi:alginate O-acetyltransferase complex protein AlgI
MSFTSWSFVVFLVLVYAGYRLLPQRGQNWLLLAASYVFYGWWDVRFLFLLILSTSIYFVTGALIHRGALTRKERVAASLWVVASAFVFVLLRWGGQGGSPSASAWPRLAPDRTAGLVFAGAVALVIVANLLYGPATRLEEGRRRRLFLWLGVGTNLAILCVFKYTNFFAENASAVLRGLGVAAPAFHLDLALPVGISFYTFQGMTYVIDIHRKRLKPTPLFRDFALFLAFFPLVLAGPIERAARLLPQITGVRQLREGQATRGFHLILIGLFKKAAIADGVAVTANAVFGAQGPVSWIDALAGAFFFALQLYCDFSGYSDMAVGIASLFGIELTQNFRTPYFSANPADFWTRWHISLSSWFRDYVFFPLGGPYGAARRWMRNVMVTFLLTGLWHGAAWNFVLWGLYHGVLLCLYRLGESARKVQRPAKNAFRTALGIASFFVLTCYGWVLFRSQSLRQIVDITSTLLFDFGNLRLTAPLPPEATLAGLPVLACIELVEYLSGGKRSHEVLPVPVWTGLYAIIIFALVLGAGSVSSQFVYFTF